jgi:hypothetical protein
MTCVSRRLHNLQKWLPRKPRREVYDRFHHNSMLIHSFRDIEHGKDMSHGLEQ